MSALDDILSAVGPDTGPSPPASTKGQDQPQSLDDILGTITPDDPAAIYKQGAPKQNTWGPWLEAFDQALGGVPRRGMAAMQTAQGLAQPPLSVKNMSEADPRGLVPFIRSEAQKYGVDPDTAVRAAMSEGLSNPVGDNGTSGGAFQLHVGGGLGDEFQKETGLDPLDPKNEKDTISWALKNLKRTGWEPYHGAARVGIGPREGLSYGQNLEAIDRAKEDWQSKAGVKGALIDALAPLPLTMALMGLGQEYAIAPLATKLGDIAPALQGPLRFMGGAGQGIAKIPSLAVRGALEGGAQGALTSGLSPDPLLTQVERGAGVGGAVNPLVGAIMPKPIQAIGKTIEAIADSNSINFANGGLGSKLAKGLTDLNTEAAYKLDAGKAGQVHDTVDRIVGEIRQRGGVLPGAVYKSWTSKGGLLDTLATEHPDFQPYVSKIRDQLDSAWKSSLSPTDYSTWKNQRRAYKDEMGHNFWSEAPGHIATAAALGTAASQVGESGLHELASGLMHGEAHGALPLIGGAAALMGVRQGVKAAQNTAPYIDRYVSRQTGQLPQYIINRLLPKSANPLTMGMVPLYNRENGGR